MANSSSSDSFTSEFHIIEKKEEIFTDFDLRSYEGNCYFEDGFPPMESFTSTRSSFAFDFHEESLYTRLSEEDTAIWRELGCLFEPKKEKSTQISTKMIIKSRREEEEKRVVIREEKGTSKGLTKEAISKYFYMPITQAAKELNVGLTLLKKRCRELGIQRWPHRKLMSIQTLIKNVQEMKRVEGEGSEGKLKEAVELLEREKRQLEEVPDMQLQHKTKRLRQACFKANYKKRKTLGIVSYSPHSSSSSSGLTFHRQEEEEEDDEEIKSLLDDPVTYENSLCF
ncbi:RWP-RK domain-containing protein [Euphorbia peplus]|nr:RWP-RK domain-containing protein [Euphorbia peplus]